MGSVRNFNITKGRPCLPARRCLKSTGRPLVTRIQIAIASMIGDATTSPIDAAVTSAIRLVRSNDSIRCPFSVRSSSIITRPIGCHPTGRLT